MPEAEPQPIHSSSRAAPGACPAAITTRPPRTCRSLRLHARKYRQLGGAPAGPDAALGRRGGPEGSAGAVRRLG